ncbi:MAG: NUDIX hydrolase [Cyclobacteriaceae bacterium]|nr:NUDIX hydrolase [Cyclobacteriaceae bacterium]
MKGKELFYENKIRARVCGLVVEDDSILLVKHTLRGKPFYAPPGGAIEFGEPIETALTREFKEETHIEVKSAEFKFITEYIKPPLHAIELFYLISQWDGTAKKGSDPENNHLIKGVNWFSMKDIKLLDLKEVHHIFHNCNNLRDILQLSGYIPYPTF